MTKNAEARGQIDALSALSAALIDGGAPFRQVLVDATMLVVFAVRVLLAIQSNRLLGLPMIEAVVLALVLTFAGSALLAFRRR